MTTAKFYDENDNRLTATVFDSLPAVGSEYPGTDAIVFAADELPRAFIDSTDETIVNGTVYLVRAEYPDDGKRFESYVLIPADMTMTADEFIANLIDNDQIGIDHMTVEDAADTLRVMRQNDYKNEIPADLTAEELARRWNESKGTDIWYALMTGPDDDDRGTGTYSINLASEWLKALRSEYPDAYIAVIREGNDPTCIEEIH